MTTFSEKFDRGDYPLLKVPDNGTCRTCEFYARSYDHLAAMTGKAKRERKAFLDRINRVHIKVNHTAKRHPVRKPDPNLRGPS